MFNSPEYPEWHSLFKDMLYVTKGLSQRCACSCVMEPGYWRPLVLTTDCDHAEPGQWSPPGSDPTSYPPPFWLDPVREAKTGINYLRLE